MHTYFKNPKYLQIIPNSYVLEEHTGVLNNAYFKYYINTHNTLSFNTISINTSIHKKTLNQRKEKNLSFYSSTFYVQMKS